MKSRFILPIVLVSLLLLTACGTNNQQTKTGGAFIGGTQGVVASFEPLSIIENEVYSVFDTEDFPLEIVLKNKGEEEVAIGGATLKLLGPAPGDFQNIPQWQLQNTEIITKISETNPEGGEEVISFTPTQRALYTGEVTGFTDITWNLEYWYNYKTHVIINDVCFKGDLTEDKVCEVKEAKAFSVSGAPITVTAVEEDTGGKGIVTLRIDVKDAGTGDSTIEGREFDNRFDQISYTIDEPEKWECKSGGRDNEARLISGLATIICRSKAPLSDSDLYVKNIRLTLNYVYKNIVQEKLRVKESER